MFGHQDAISELQKYLAELDGDLSDAGQWLFDTPTDFKRLLGQIEEDLVKRTNNLSELVRINPASDFTCPYPVFLIPARCINRWLFETVERV